MRKIKLEDEIIRIENYQNIYKKATEDGHDVLDVGLKFVFKSEEELEKTLNEVGMHCSFQIMIIRNMFGKNKHTQEFRIKKMIEDIKKIKYEPHEKMTWKDIRMTSVKYNGKVNDLVVKYKSGVIV